MALDSEIICVMIIDIHIAPAWCAMLSCHLRDDYRSHLRGEGYLRGAASSV
jgi:hypothetical protein